MTDVAVAETPSIKDLVTAKEMDTDTLMAMLGQKDLSSTSSESTKAYLPRLSIEHNTESGVYKMQMVKQFTAILLSFDLF